MCTLEKEITFEEKQWASVSDTCKDLIRSMLNKEPALRPDIETVLNHPWFK